MLGKTKGAAGPKLNNGLGYNLKALLKKVA
jgi:hypothetical protein